MTRKISGYIRDSQLAKMTEMSKSTLWRLRQQNKFPEKVQLSENIKGTHKEDEEDWLQDPQGWNKKRGQEVKKKKKKQPPQIWGRNLI